MKQSARDVFVEFTSKFEGVVPWMYLDVEGLVTVAIGNLIDPIGAALGLPFVHKGTTTPATSEEIATEWTMVKNHPTAAKQGHLVLQTVTQLRLTPDGVEKVVSDRLAINESILRKRFPGYDDWPADAQLATNSMAWANGPYFRFPQLAAALLAGDFATAADTCHIDDRNNPGVTPRNAADRELYLLAARAVTEGLEPEELFYNESGRPTADQLMQSAPIVHPEVLS